LEKGGKGIENAEIKARMGKVKHKIVVMSGKGGVGKSTVSVNLALALSKKGHKVGILDADVTGPNVPKMLGMPNERPMWADEGIIPPEKSGIKVISMAFVLETEDRAVIWRGPLIMRTIEQFLSDVNWGELDYLIVDLPPGTGDETLSIMQFIPEMEGVIVVTTPQDVALLDGRKSISMAKEMKIPVLGVVENMSGFTCPHCGGEIDLFKTGGGEKTAKELKLPFLGKIPLDPGICEGGDEGRPFILGDDSPAAGVFNSIVEKIVKGIGKK